MCQIFKKEKGKNVLPFSFTHWLFAETLHHLARPFSPLPSLLTYTVSRDHPKLRVGFRYFFLSAKAYMCL